MSRPMGDTYATMTAGPGRVSATVIHNDVVSALADVANNTFDAVLCDPPYGLSFMGKKWDYDVPGAALWREVLRVCKPGAALIAFSGTRTYHRTVVQIEDAGWEIRDQLAWMYGSGFPKSLDVSKAIDAAAGAVREVTGPNPHARPSDGQTLNAMGTKTHPALTAPSTDAARAWSGWGTSLKPAFEPAVLARKPLEGTVAANVAKWGVGALAIDASRIGTEDSLGGGREKGPTSVGEGWDRPWMHDEATRDTHAARTAEKIKKAQALGRWPANVILDEAAGAILDAQAGNRPGMSGGGTGKRDASMFGVGVVTKPETVRGDDGGPSRFYYTAKASRKERNAGCESVVTWENVDLGFETESMLRLAKGISDDTMRLLEGSEWSTSLCGRQHTDQFQTGFKCTIETASRLIIELKTSNASQPLNTRGSILAATRTMLESGSNPVDCVESIRLLQQATTDGATASALAVVSAALLQLSEVSKKGRPGNGHSTVKPIDLMRYLARLIMPSSQGKILVPFAGSGSEMIGALLAGWPDVTGIEREAEYVAIARARVALAARKP